MKSFTQYLVEADYSRFLKKNNNLSDTQRDEINTYFSKTNTQAGSGIDWQSKKVRKWSYDDFLDIMIKSKSGRKQVIKHKAIKGLTEGDDYVHVRMPSKEYLAYIPLNYEAAQKFNTRDMGVCSGPWCIGHSGDPTYWNSEVIQELQVPIYVINRHSKWVVMIQEGNRKYDVWSVENNPKKIREGIPNFSIRKNLLNPKQKAMYDEIREDYYDEETEPEEIDIDDALVDYDNLIEDIENSGNARESAEEYAREQFWEECERIKSDTKDEYRESIEIHTNEFERLDALFDSGEELRDELDGERDDWIENDEEGDEPTATFDDEADLTVDEIQNRLDTIETAKDELYDKVSELEDDINTINNIEPYEMINNNDIEWSEEPPDEDYIYEDLDVDLPSITDGKYSDYVDLAEEHMGFSARHSAGSVDQDIAEYSYGGSRAGTAEEVLEYHELYHPEYVNNR